MEQLLGKTIVISGGTKGVGKCIVSECLKQGANVVFGGRDLSSAKKICESAKEYKERLIFVETDLLCIEMCKKMFDVAVEKFGSVDGFVNYAGISTPASLTECTESTYDNIFDVNMKAAFFCCQYAVKQMIKNGGGSIVLCGSPHAWGGELDRAAYSCSKGALMALSNHIAKNYAVNNIRCNHFVLGWTETEGEISMRESQNMSRQELRDFVSDIVPMKRIIQPDEYSSAVVFLLSDNSKILTGSDFRMTAGLYI